MRNRTRTSRGFTLIEVVVIVLVLAIAVPPTLELLMSNAASRANTINTSRATVLASSVLECVIADVASADGSLGFGALADADAYLNADGTGLYDRMDAPTQSFEDLGFTYVVEIGALVSSDGTVSGDSDENIFRAVTVRVGYPSSEGGSYSMPVSVLVSAL